MSHSGDVDDEPELRELVTEALEKSGVLARARAHLRAGVFLALEREHDHRQHHRLAEALASRDGLLALLLVQELLDFCELRHAASVYRAETGQPRAFAYAGREDVLRRGGLAARLGGAQPQAPLLVQLVTAFMAATRGDDDDEAERSANHNEVPSEAKAVDSLDVSAETEAPSVDSSIRIRDSRVHSSRCPDRDLSYDEMAEKSANLDEVPSEAKAVDSLDVSAETEAPSVDSFVRIRDSRVHSSQCPDRDLSDEAPSYDEDFEDESNIINKLTASSMFSLDYGRGEDSSPRLSSASVLDESVPEGPTIERMVVERINRLRTTLKRDRVGPKLTSSDSTNDASASSSNGLSEELKSVDLASADSAQSVSTHSRMNGTE